MSLLGNWLAAKNVAQSVVDGPVLAKLNQWRDLPEADLSGPLDRQRWLVVDVETTGLDMHRDQLLAIGAVVVEGRLIQLDQSFEVVLRQDAPSREANILIHRIAGGEQVDGIEPAEALASFLEFAQKLPCVAFHAAFDETMLRRACRGHLGIDFSPQFVDLAHLAPALFPEAPSALRSLDDWVAYFSIGIHARHRAVADALGTAQLFQALLARATERNIASAQKLFSMARDQRWLAGLAGR
ncbi:MAG: 3'-5' exonuclease [Betaproteobacteria bacterium]|nr:3'-5' exonuclease [Betaproteobacteria bacterium]